MYLTITYISGRITTQRNFILLFSNWDNTLVKGVISLFHSNLRIEMRCGLRDTLFRCVPCGAHFFICMKWGIKMTTNNCLLCDKVFENMKGKLMIYVNEPKDVFESTPVYIRDTTGNIQAKIATGSTYIIDIKEETKISAQYFLNTNSVSDYVKISPEEFNYIEVDYDYYIIKNLHGVKKAVLKKMEHKKDKKYK